MSPPWRWLPWLAATALVAACGLPDARPVLALPVRPLAEDNRDRFTFAVPPDPNPVEFQGYVVFYRLFDDEQERLNLRPSQLCRPDFFLLGSADHRPDDDAQCPPLGTVLPLIPEPAAAVERVVLDFSDLEQPVARLEPGAGENDEIALRRDVVRDDRFAAFTDCEFAADPDLALLDPGSGCPGRAAGDRVRIQLYVMSYGVTESGGPLWSEAALSLGSITLP